MIPYFVFDTIQIGPLIVHTWGLFAGLAFAAALFVALKEAKRKNIKEDYIFDLAVLVLAGGVAGARLLFAAENWNYYSENISGIFSLNEGGLMFYGGAIGAAILVFIYIKFRNISLGRVADAFTPSFAIGEFIGRIGCALGDLHIGAKTFLPWAQEYLDGTARHPIAIYMSLNGLAMFMVLWFLRRKVKIEGALFSLFVLWYSGTRFFLDFLRCNDLEICDPRYSGWTPSQYISSGAFIISLIFLILIIRRSANKKHMAEQQNGDSGDGEGKINENKDLQGSAVSYTEVEEVIFESNANDAESDGKMENSAGWKNKLRAAAKKPWARAAAFFAVLAIGAIAASVYYNSVYYGRMFKNPPFAFQGKTWVSYDEPIVKITVINDLKCEACNSEPIIKYLKSGVTPALAVEEIGFDFQKSKDLIGKFNIKFLPAFIFDSTVGKLKTFETTTPEEMGRIFAIKDNQYYINPAAISSIANRLGINLGRFIYLPQVTADDRVKGPESAPVAIIEFSDFKCPYCKAENDVVKQILAAYPDKVRLVFKHLPLPIHPEAQYAAEAAECAGDQGKFFEMSDALFAKQDKLDKVSIAGYARILKLDAKKFKECIDSGKFKSKIANDSQVAGEFGIAGTPAFFVGDKFLSGAMPFEQFKEIIDAKLAE